MNIKTTDIKNHFSKAVSTYNDDAQVQAYMAASLFDLLKEKNYKNILEIGCGTGLLSNYLVSHLNFCNLTLNDISKAMLDHVKQSFSNEKNISYLLDDANKLSLNQNYDLIISNACFQWLNDLSSTLNKLKNHLSDDGEIVFSTFLDRNFYEVKEISGVSLDYLSEESVKSILNKLNLNFSIKRETKVVYFDSVKDLLKSFKNTGVSGISGSIWTKSKLNYFINTYKNKFEVNSKIPLTWDILYVHCQKN